MCWPIGRTCRFKSRREMGEALAFAGDDRASMERRREGQPRTESMARRVGVGLRANENGGGERRVLELESAGWVGERQPAN